MTVAELRAWLVSAIAERLALDPAAIDAGAPFSSYGLDSLRASALIGDLGRLLERPLSPVLVWEYPSIESLAAHLTDPQAARTSRPDAVRPATANDEPIAVVGLGCRLPGAPNVGAFWTLLREGRDAIRDVPDGRWDAALVQAVGLHTAEALPYRQSGFLDDVAGFDAAFFGVSPREAAQMDPQQRLLLEVAWEALDDAGIPPDELKGSLTGVFVGIGWPDYGVVHRLQNGAITQHSGTGQAFSIAANRISYVLGLQGPSIAMDTACSSSLVAVHVACQSLRNGEASLALAGGVNLLVSPGTNAALRAFGGLSADARLRPFDAHANGFVRGEGAGLVVLKPLVHALRDGDRIYCVIRGSATNNDGATNGLTAPSPAAQEAVVAEALRRAGVAPSQVDYVEAHGTGTVLGDPIEAQTLGRIYGAERGPEQPLLIGSVKANIGHLESAAGVASLIKACLMLERQVVLPTIHHAAPNPQIDFEGLRLAVATTFRPWPERSHRGRVGISGFGWGGTNCHVVLEASPVGTARLLPLAADSRADLERLARRMTAEAVDLTDCCAEAMREHTRGMHRLALVASSSRELEDRLETLLSGGATPGAHIGEAQRTPGPLVFVFSPQGSQWPGMGRLLLNSEPVFRDMIERCDRVVRAAADWSLLAELFASPEHARLDEARIVQPVLVCLQMGLAALWRSWGIEPDAVVGHSMGEISAAQVAGILDIESAARLACEYARLQDRPACRGGMALINLPAGAVEQRLQRFGGEVVIGGENGPAATLISGEPAAIEEILAEYREQQVFCAPVQVNVAAHGPRFEPLVDEMRQTLTWLRPRPAVLPMFSTVTGDELAGPECDGVYWGRNLRERVRFAPVIERLIRTGHGSFLEISPHGVLTHAVRQALDAAGVAGTVLPSLRRGSDERAAMRDSLGALFVEGRSIRWERLDAVAARAGEPAAAALFPLSARSPDALKELAGALLAQLDQSPAGTLDDLCLTAATRRSHLEHRLGIVASSRAELSERLQQFLAGAPGPGSAVGERTSGTRPPVVFIFPGQGSQWTGMGRQLLAQEPVFRTALEECEEALRPFVDWSLLEQLAADEDAPGYLLDRIDVIQPTLIALDIALARLWRSWGIEPDAVVGHSMGEVAAAHVAGALSLEDAMRVIAERSRLLRRVSGRGAMAVVELPREAAETALAGYEDRVSIAASNSPRSTILSGDVAALESILATLERQDVFCRLVNVDVASHSAQVDPLRDDLLAALRGIEPRPTRVPFFSTVLDRPLDGTELGPDYWQHNLRQPVLFTETVQQLLRGGHEIFLEVSPHPVLLPAVQQTIQHAGSPAIALGSLRRNEAERATLLQILGELYVAGRPIAWRRVQPAGRFIPLPPYAWQRERFWFEPAGRRASRAVAQGAHPLIGEAIRSALGQHLWEADIGTDLQPYLADHRVRGRAVLPAAAHLEMALAAAEALGPGPATLEDFRFEEALFVGTTGDGTAQVQVVLDPDSAQAGTVHIFSRGAGPTDGPWTRIATGRIVRDSGASVVPPALLVAVPEAVQPGAEHYVEVAARGLDYGPSFQGVEAFWRADDATAGRIRLPAEAREGAAGYHIHPALLDACLQLVLPCVHDGRDPDGVYLPVAVRRLRLYRRPEPDAVFYGLARGRRDGADFCGEALLLDAEGRPVVSVEGLCLRRVGQESERQIADWLYAPEWQPQSRRASIVAPAAPGTWLVLADTGGVAAETVARLENAGQVCRVVRTRASVTHGLGSAPDAETSYVVDPERPNDFELLLSALPADLPPLRGVIHLWSLDAVPTEDACADELEAAQRLGTISLLHLVQALARREAADAPRLWVVTRGAQAVHEDRGVPALAHAMLWGMGAVLAHEHPELRCSCVDLDPATADAAALADEVLAAGAEDRVALRAGGRFVARLIHRPALASDGLDPDPAVRRVNAPYRVVTTGAGVLENLRPKPLARRRPEAGQVEIEVRAAGLNFMNVLSAMGMYPGYPDGVGPLGIECAGVISAVGDGVDGLHPGDEVVAIGHDTLATHALADARLVAPKPVSLGFEEAATIPVAFLTAAYALEHLAHLAEGERVLIHAAAGGVGLAAIQLARLAGAEIFATAGSPEKREYLNSLGIEHVFDSRALDFAEQIRAVTAGEGVDVVLNSLSGEAIGRSLSLLRPYGRFLEIGKRDIYDNARLGLSPFRNHLSYFAIDLDRGLRERTPLLGGLLREIMVAAGTGELDPLPRRLFSIAQVTDAFRLMAQSRHIGKLVLTPEATVEIALPADAHAVPLRSDATYLIAGGLGGLGLSVARWLVEEGARHLVLVGRSGASDEAVAIIAELEAMGARVVPERADVAVQADVARVLARIAGEMPPLRGIIHAAGVLADATVLQMDRATLLEPMRAKLRGAWNLHRLTAHRTLDFFVLFSSAASVLGTLGQANYAAANAFMDALAHARRAQGLPALSINWGAWTGVGLAAAQSNRGERLATQGMASMTPAQGVAALGWALSARVPQVAIMRLDVARWCAIHPTAASSALLAGLRDAGAAARQTEQDASGLRQTLLAALPGREREELIENHLRERVAEVLRLAPARVSLSAPLQKQGLDSLMTLELRNRLDADLGIPVSATVIYNYPSVTLLARYLAGELSPVDMAGEPAQKEPAPPDEPGPPDALLEGLGREQIESLLDREMAAIDELLAEN
jgi:acyl transferase domain-containing protein/NADPH:quinone reductase-like Zn-dependent oxidoreductase/NAD(P)-dependent dehydrogenase (short-subunit alcohol dehydrogenase family)/acyl carrier protein